METFEAKELVDEIILISEEICDENPHALDYAESVREKAEDIMNSVEEYDNVTFGQESALINMRDGLERWRR